MNSTDLGVEKILKRLQALFRRRPTGQPVPRQGRVPEDLASDRRKRTKRRRMACGAAYCRSRNYRSAEVDSAFLKAVHYP